VRVGWKPGAGWRRLGWGPRQILALALLAVIFILTSGLIELATTARVTAEGAAVESGLIAQILLQHIVHIAGTGAAQPLEAVRTDPGVMHVLQAATAQAPSVVYVAVCDPGGAAVIHTTPELVGRPLSDAEPLPHSRSLLGWVRLLGHLRRTPPVYEERTPLLLGDIPFATIRVGLAGGLLRERVDEVFRRRLGIAGIQLGLALCVGAILAWVLRGRLRQLEAGITAMREGRFDARIPEEGVDEFSRLARDLNLLSEEFGRVRQGSHGSDASLRSTVELLGDGLLTLGPNLEVVLLNGPASRVLGLGPEAVGRPIGSILPDAHPVRKLAETLYADGGQTLTVALPTTGSTPARVAVGHRIAGQDGPGGVLVELKEPAALRELHALVDQSRVLRRLGEMAAGVAHEIRNPLTGIANCAQVLQEGMEADDSRQRFLKIILEEAARLNRIVEGLLRYARPNRPELRETEVEELVVRALDLVRADAEAKGIRVTVRMSGRIPRLFVDPGQIEQVLLNLLRNGADAMPAGGELSVGLSVVRRRPHRRRGIGRRASDRQRVRATEEGPLVRFVQIRVTDTGHGIPREMLPRIFHPFYTTRSRGTGLGLSLAQSIVREHGGFLTVRSVLNKGTVFHLDLPVERRQGERRKEQR